MYAREDGHYFFTRHPLIARLATSSPFISNSCVYASGNLFYSASTRCDSINRDLLLLQPDLGVTTAISTIYFLSQCLMMHSR